MAEDKFFDVLNTMRRVKPYADIDGLKGPFNSVQEGLDATRDLRLEGKSFYVLENGKRVEYVFEGGIEDSNLVRVTTPTGGQIDLSIYATNDASSLSDQDIEQWKDKLNVTEGGEYELTSAKVTTALGYTPIANTHASNEVTSTLISNWNTAFTNNHTHSNKTVLDGITQAKVNAWDAKLDGIVGTKLRYVMMKPDGSFDVEVPSSGILKSVIGYDENNEPKMAETVKLIDLDTTVTPLTDEILLLKTAIFVICPNISLMYIKAGAFWKKINLIDL